MQLRKIVIFLEFMDALTAPKEFQNTESMSQTRMRGLGIEESDRSATGDSMQARQRETAKPRGTFFSFYDIIKFFYIPFHFLSETNLI